MRFSRRRQSKSKRSASRAFFEGLESRQMLTAVVWSGTGGNTLFSNGANWVGGVAPTSGQDVDFPSSTSFTSVDVNSAVTVGNVEFDAAYTLTGDSITVNGGITTTDGLTTVSNQIELTQASTTINTYETGALDLTGLIGQSGDAYGLTVEGNGPLTLGPGTESYTGTTTVSGGVLDLNGEGVDSVIDLSPTSSFNGTGLITTLEGNNANFSASSAGSPGNLAIDDGLNLDTDSGNTVSVLLDGTNNSSVFTVDGGTISLGDATLTGSAVNGYVPTPGDVITIIKNNTDSPVTGTFDSLPQGGTVDIGGDPYTISYTGGSGNDVTLTADALHSSVALTSSHVPVYQGHTVTLTATVTGNGATPTGTVTFYDDGNAIGSPVTLVDGVASINDTTLPVGSNTITASYSGDSSYGSSNSSSLTANVRANSTATTPTITSATSTASTHGYTIGATVVGADTSSAGAAGLTYTWTAIHLPSGAKNPTFSANGTNAASSIIARFSKDGGYILQCKVSNAAGNYVTTDVDVTVSQKATSLKIEPHKAQITTDGFEQYTGTVLDQFGHAMRTAQTLAWAVTAGPGSINSTTGLFSSTSVESAVTIELEADDLTATVGAKVV